MRFNFGQIICILCLFSKGYFACLTKPPVPKPVPKPEPVPELIFDRHGETLGCKATSGKDCFVGIYNLKKQPRLSTTCSYYEDITGRPLPFNEKPWCFTDPSSETTAECNSDCPGVKAEAMAVSPGNTVSKEDDDNVHYKCFCGLRNQERKKIVHGETANIGEFPWQVALLDSPFGFGFVSRFSQFCGGTLVGEKHIITAAHCVFGKKIDNIRVLLGVTNLAVDEMQTSNANYFQHELSEIREHPLFNNHMLANDIAVLVLADPVDLYIYPNIKPACLPLFEKNIDELIGKEAVISGWGRIGILEPSTSQLQQAMVKILQKDQCWHGNKEDAFCAEGINKIEGPCKGDSGGPLVLKDEKSQAYTLIGVSSKTREDTCADPKYPAVFADVNHFLYTDGWLMSALIDGYTCGREPILPYFKDGSKTFKYVYQSLFDFHQVQVDYDDAKDADECQEYCTEHNKCQTWTWEDGVLTENCKMFAVKKSTDGVIRGTKYPKYW